MEMKNLSIFILFVCFVWQGTCRRNCPRLHLKNGRAKIQFRGRMAFFRCRDGFRLIGKKYALCTGQTWSNPKPVCFGCPDLTNTSNLIVARLPSGMTLTFSCPQGLSLQGQSSMECKGQNWKGKLPRCVEVCPTLPKGDHLVAIRVPSSPSTVRIHCAAGYVLSGRNIMLCNGERWEGAVPTCAPGESPAYSCDFENGWCDWIQEDVSDDADWTLHSGSTPSRYTGPNRDHTTNTSNGHYIYLESSNTVENQKAVLRSPIYPADSSYSCFEFWYHMRGHPTHPTHMGQLNVYVQSLSQPEMKLFSKQYHQGEKWLYASVDIPQLYEQFQILLEALDTAGGTSYISDMAVDDVNLNTKCKEKITTTVATTTPSTTQTPSTTTPSTTQMPSTTTPSTTQTTTTETTTTQTTTTQTPSTPSTTTTSTTTSIPSTRTTRIIYTPKLVKTVQTSMATPPSPSSTPGPTLYKVASTAYETPSFPPFLATTVQKKTKTSMLPPKYKASTGLPIKTSSIASIDKTSRTATTVSVSKQPEKTEGPQAATVSISTGTPKLPGIQRPTSPVEGATGKKEELTSETLLQTKPPKITNAPGIVTKTSTSNLQTPASPKPEQLTSTHQPAIGTTYIPLVEATVKVTPSPSNENGTQVPNNSTVTTGNDTVTKSIRPSSSLPPRYIGLIPKVPHTGTNLTLFNNGTNNGTNLHHLGASNTGDDSDVGLAVGIGLGLLALIALTGLIIWLIKRKRQRKTGVAPNEELQPIAESPQHGSATKLMYST